MNGMDLGRVLSLMRMDLRTLLSVLVLGILSALLIWATLGSRKLLRKCLAVSLLLHVCLVEVGGRTPWGQRLFQGWDFQEASAQSESIQRIALVPSPSEASGDGEGLQGERGAEGRDESRSWDRPSAIPLLGMAGLEVPRFEPPSLASAEAEPVDLTPAALRVTGANPPLPLPGPRQDRALPELAGEPVVVPEPLGVTETLTADLPAVAVRPAPIPVPDLLATARQGAEARPTAAGLPARDEMPVDLGNRGAGSFGVPLGLAVSEWSAGDGDRMVPGGIEIPETPVATVDAADLPAGATGDGGPGRSLVAPRPAVPLAMPGFESDLASSVRRSEPLFDPLGRDRVDAEPTPLARSLPSALLNPDLTGARPGLRALPDVPEVYRPRLDPDRSRRAQRVGATTRSEEAVARALDWLARHQDGDGRWDGASGRNRLGQPVAGEDDFTVHCPPGEVCFGECHYWEADSAMTGLALLTYLGAGYTHREGPYAATVQRGLDYLVGIQKEDGDLRGESKAVGMYCHAMAALAVCEAYALTGDPKLGESARRAVSFLVRAQARDGMSWRYQPEAAIGDTSILGWVILVLKSAQEVGIEVPSEVKQGAARWLRLVSKGAESGLATYQVGEPITETMTAEAWVCRQFLGIGGPGATSSEAARYLLDHPPSNEFNIYYLYYATLAMYQQGGPEWIEWNEQVRDVIVDRQRTEGHQAGSWDPDESRWGRYGGRIYTTALSTLSLEVYYRYLRLYDAPAQPPIMAPSPAAPAVDSILRRAIQQP